MMKVIFSSLFWLLFLICSAQRNNISIIKDSRVDDLVAKHKEFNAIQETISGYRIQIFSSTGNFSKTNATNQLNKFQSQYPDVKAYVIFQTPYYVVRVGNFRTRLNAEAFRQKILNHYPEAYIVKDDINLPD